MFLTTYGQELWYDKPASNWNEALPVGNGRIGAMLFGGTDIDKIQLNEETVWAGEPGNNIPDGVFPHIKKIRQLLFKGKNKEAQELAKVVFPRQAPKNLNYGMPYQTVGNLELDFGHKVISNYKRSLDLNNAVSQVSYVYDGVTYKRSYFISYPDQVMVVHLKASAPGKLSFGLQFNSKQDEQDLHVMSDRLILEGKTSSIDNKEGKVRFESIIKPVLKSGKLEKRKNGLYVQEADEVTLFVSIGTNFKNYKSLSNNAHDIALGHLNAAQNKTFSNLKETHIKDYQNLYARVALKLGTNEKSEFDQFTTRERLDAFDGSDLDLVALYFQFGRYLLISSSRPGGQPANLQGIWNAELTPPWDSKYTVNINTEMNYWPAEVTNLSELHQPLFTMLKELAETGKESASKMYNASGWNMHHNTDLWRVTGVIDGGFYGMWPMGGAWLTQHIWQHYLYTGDQSFLEEYYSVLKGCAQFYADVLQEEPEHNWLVVAPSMSPENKYEDGVGISYGTTMDNQLVFDVFSNLIKASEILDKDEAFRQEVINKSKRLPPMQIGKHNQLQEWIKDWDRTDDHHRHISHLYGLHPSNQISPFRNPQLFQAAKNTLTYRGDKSTGWSMGWKVNFWARLLNGNRAYDLIKTQLHLVEDGTKEGGTYPNLLDAHPPFQIDGNFGCTAGIAEMLLQSQDEAIHLLPALPDAWATGTVKGLKTRGGFICDFEWKENQLETVRIKSQLGGVCRLRTKIQLVDQRGIALKEAQGTNDNPFFQNSKVSDPLMANTVEISTPDLGPYYLYDIETVKGETLVLKAFK